MGDHDYEAVFGNRLQYVHDLDGGNGIKGTSRFIGEDYIWIVNNRASDRDALALSTRKLIWIFTV